MDVFVRNAPKDVSAKMHLKMCTLMIASKDVFNKCNLRVCKESLKVMQLKTSLHGVHLRVCL
jgi:hypothetical protein